MLKDDEEVVQIISAFLKEANIAPEG